MADKPSKKPEPINPSLHKHTVRYLKKLTKTGVHGKTVGEVARVLICDQIKLLIDKGALRWEFDDGDDNDEEGEKADAPASGPKS